MGEKVDWRDIRIGHTGDAIALLDEMIEEAKDAAQEAKLRALLDAIQRGII
jgi:hypothetical protein